MEYSKFKSPRESTGLLFWRASVVWQRKIKEALQPLDITQTQFVILAVIEELYKREKSITQKMISDFSMIDVMTVSSTVRLLKKKGYIDREESENDTRAYSIFNTEIGREKLNSAIIEVRRIDSEFFFSDEDELNNFRSELKSLIEDNFNKE